MNKTKSLQWKVNTAGLLKEVLSNNETSILARPIQIFGLLLAQVAERASQLDDHELNKLMARLSLYAETDPYGEHYDAERTKELLDE